MGGLVDEYVGEWVGFGAILSRLPACVRMFDSYG